MICGLVITKPLCVREKSVKLTIGRWEKVSCGC